MKDSIREINEIPELTMGLDLGKKFLLLHHRKVRTERGRR